MTTTMNKLILALLTVGAIATAAIPANAEESLSNITNQRVDQRGTVERKVKNSDVPGDVDLTNQQTKQGYTVERKVKNSDVPGDVDLTNQQTRQGYTEKRSLRERQ